MSVFISAEIGINHNGDIKICKELIKVASDSGCDAVKFQKRDIDQVYTKEYLDSSRESPWGSTQRDQKAGLEFNFDDYKEIDEYCDSLKIDWYASAWDLNSQKFLRQFNCKYNKIASAMIVYEELLKEVALEKKHTFISTGMCGYEEIDKAVNFFEKVGCSYELMHTISTYPMKDEDANLKMIDTLKKRYGVNVGYSGHEAGLAISYAAAAMGISSLERHITLDRSMYGSDQSASLEPRGLRELVGSIRTVEKCLGDEKIGNIIDEEIPIANKLRAHINS